MDVKRLEDNFGIPLDALDKSPPEGIQEPRERVNERSGGISAAAALILEKRRSDPTPGARQRAKVEGRETEGGADGR